MLISQAIELLLDKYKNKQWLVDIGISDIDTSPNQDGSQIKSCILLTVNKYKPANLPLPHIWCGFVVKIRTI